MSSSASAERDVVSGPLRARDVAERLGVSVPYVYALAADGVLPCLRVGRTVRFERDRFERWLEERRG